jgi:hypothetical protein
MKGSFRAIAAVALVALLGPVAAGAKEARINGPATLAGQGYFGGELAMSLADGQRPVHIAGRGGYVGFLDLAGDLKVRCSGRVQKTRTEQGVAYLCKGRGGQATVLGSHFKLRGFARQYRAALPEGVRGTFHGRFVLCSPRCAAAERPARPTREPAERNPAERTPAPQDDEEIPTVDELAALLDG